MNPARKHFHSRWKSTLPRPSVTRRCTRSGPPQATPKQAATANSVIACATSERPTLERFKPLTSWFGHSTTQAAVRSRNFASSFRRPSLALFRKNRPAKPYSVFYLYGVNGQGLTQPFCADSGLSGYLNLVCPTQKCSSFAREPGEGGNVAGKRPLSEHLKRSWLRSADRRAALAR